jgi:hypothetical protein
MDLISDIFGTVIVLAFILLLFWYMVRYNTKTKQMDKVIQDWKDNPTQMDLGLATTAQIIKEINSRSQPVILLIPEMPKHQDQMIGSVQIYISGIDKNSAESLLVTASELLRQNKETDNTLEEW